jgi:tetratricopeptide (TPR) repeat protein
MRKLCFVLAWVCMAAAARSQTAATDSFKVQLAKAKTTEEKVEILGLLSRTLMNVNLPEAEKYGKQMIEVAEISRDRKLMVKALLANGERYSYLAGRKDNIEKAISYYNQALELAKKNKLEEQMISAYLLLSEVSRYIPTRQKPLTMPTRHIHIQAS